MVTQLMSLTLPTVSSTPAPLYAQMLNAALVAVDSHDHSPGFGAKVRTAGLAIDADLSFGDFNATALRSVRFQNLGTPPALGTDIACLAVAGGNLYYVNASGAQVQITAGAGLNATSIGGVGGDYSTSGASEFYTAASSTFSFWSAANKSANLDAGNVVIRQPGVVSPFGITLQSPASLAAAYALTLPTALPGTTLPLLVSNTGAMSTAQITGSQIANSTLTNANQNFGTPSVATDVAIKSYVDAKVATAPNWQTGWTLGTNWSASLDAAYAKGLDGYVTLRGTLFAATGAGQNGILTLPAGFRPVNAGGSGFAVPYFSTPNYPAASLFISTAGVVNLRGPSPVNGDTIWLDGIQFSTQ